MSQTRGIYNSTDLFSRSKGEVHTSDADESADKKGGKITWLVRMQRAVA
jgi:hypothetical protein